MIDSEHIVKAARQALEDKQAIDPVALDVRGLTGVTDFYLLATGTSAPHLKALVEETEKQLRELGIKRFRRSGTSDSDWIALDFVDVVVHVFTPDARSYYDLEQLWNDAPRS